MYNSLPHFTQWSLFKMIGSSSNTIALRSFHGQPKGLIWSSRNRSYIWMNLIQTCLTPVLGVRHCECTLFRFLPLSNISLFQSCFINFLLPQISHEPWEKTLAQATNLHKRETEKKSSCSVESLAQPHHLDVSLPVAPGVPSLFVSRLFAFFTHCFLEAAANSPFTFDFSNT